MFSTDPTDLQKIPRSEFAKRKAYWLLWKKANSQGNADDETPHPTIPGVTISGDLGPPDSTATVLE